MNDVKFQQFQQQQQMQQMAKMQQMKFQKQLEEMSFKEQATGLIFVTSNCFKKCVHDFSSMELTTEERACNKLCGQKLFGTLNRISKAFQENQDKLNPN
jgi:hypothetical protein